MKFLKYGILFQKRPSLFLKCIEISLHFNNFKVRLVSQATTANIFRSLKKHEVSKEMVLKQPKLFEIPKQELYERLQHLSELGEKGDSLISILVLSKKDFLKYIELRGSNGDKIKELSEQLKIPELTARKVLLKYRFMWRSKVSTIKKKIDVILEGGIQPDDLLKDMWSLTYNIEHLKGRIDKAKELKLLPIKPWMLHCQEDVLQRISTIREENRLAMAPHSSSMDYLRTRLSLSEEEFQIFSSRHPPVVKVQVAKLKELIDFLLSEGFTKSQIHQTPRVLCHSLETIKNRLDSVRKRNYEPYTLFTLCKNKKLFDEFLAKLDGGSNSKGVT